jgi:hypothetical protein
MPVKPAAQAALTGDTSGDVIAQTNSDKLTLGINPAHGGIALRGKKILFFWFLTKHTK